MERIASALKNSPARGRTITCLCALLVHSGCTTLDPVFVSRPLMTTNYSAKPADTQTQSQTQSQYYGTLPLVIDDVNQLRYDLMSAVRAETALPRFIGATLLPLSAVAMYKGLTASNDFNEKWLAAAGLLGASAYTYGANFTSRSRAQIYLAASDALGCAVLASSPFLYAKTAVEGTPKSLKEELETLGKRLDEAQQSLDRSLSSLVARDRQLAAAAPPKPVVKQKCGPPPGGSVDDIGTVRSAPPGTTCRPVPITPQAGNESRIVALQQIRQAIRPYEAEIRSAKALQADTRRLLVGIERAGELLRGAAVNVQSRMDEEIIKTEPNLGAILQSFGGMRALGYQLTNASRLAPPSPKGAGAAGAEAKAAPLKPAVLAEEKATAKLAELEQAMAQLRDAMAPLREQVEAARHVSQQTGRLAQCQLTLPGHQITVVPDQDEVVLPAGASQVFIVTVPSGAPIAELAGSGTEKVERRVEVAGSAHKVTLGLKPSTSLAAGETLFLYLSDNSGKATRILRIVGDAAPEAGDKVAGNSVAPISEKTRKSLCEAFGAASGTTNCDGDAAVVRCRKTLDPAIDPATPITQTEALALIKERTGPAGKCQ